MTEAPMPRIAQFGLNPALTTTTGNLDTAKLIDAAKVKLAYARGEVNRIKREYELKRLEIIDQARVKMEDIHAEMDTAIEALNEETAQQAKPAREMIELVGKMLKKD
jgi:hypothetical protein